MGYRFPEETMGKLLKEDKILFGEDENKIIELKVYAKDYQEKLSSIVELDGRLGSYDLKNLFDKSARIFNNPKPVRFLNMFFPFIMKHNDIMLDFFAGSCTAANAILELSKKDGLNRKFIMVQLPEQCDENSEAFKAGYKTIANIGKERIRRVIKKIKDEDEGDLPFKKDKPDLGFKVFKLRDSNFKIWRTKIESEDRLLKQMELHTDPVDKNAETENILYELLLKSGVPLTAKIEEKNGVFIVNDNELALILEKVDKSIIKSVINATPQKVIVLDRLFKNNDQLKTNTALQMKDAGIELKAI